MSEPQRTALVTGGNRGIGLAICHGLAQLGVRVILGSRDAEAGRRAAAEIDGNAGAVTAEPLDVGDRDSVQALADRLERAGIAVSILVNNAAIYPAGSVLEVETPTIEEAWRVNVLGPWLLVKAFVPAMVQRGYGRVVNVSSESGSLGHGSDPGHAAYGVSKSALNSLTVNLARSLPASIKVNTMCPGWVRTRMGGGAAPRTPEQGADTALWLATLDDNGPTGGFFQDRRPLEW